MNPLSFRDPVRRAAALLLAATALSGAALAQTVTVTDFVHETEDGTTVTIPSIEATDANLDEAQIRAILSGEDTEAAARLAALTATEVRIPEMRMAYTFTHEDEEETGELVYRDIVLSNVEAGVAASSAVAGLTIATSDGLDAEIGPLTTGRLDIATVLQIYELVDGPEITAPVTLYEDVVFEGGTLSFEDGECSFGGFTSSELRGRPLALPMAALETMAEEFAAAEEADEDPPESAVATLVSFYADYLQAFESGPSRFEGFSCDIVSDEGERLAISSGPMEFGAYYVGEPFDLSFSDLSIAVEDDGWMRLGTAAIEGIDFSGVLASIAAMGDFSATGWPEDRVSELLPSVAALVVRDFAMDIPDEDDDGEETGRIRVQLDEFVTSARGHVNGIPTEVSVDLGGLRVPVDATSDNELFQQLDGLGYTELALGFSLGVRWDAEGETLHVDRLSFSGGDMGSLTLSATARNAGEALFSGDRDAMLEAATALAVTELDLVVEDAGLRRRLIEFNARQQGQDVATFSAAMSMVAQGAAAGLLAGSEAAVPVAQALGAFVGGAASTLDISLRARSEDGFGLADFMAVQADPSAATQLIDIGASAGGGAAPGGEEDQPPPPPPPPADDKDEAAEAAAKAGD